MFTYLLTYLLYLLTELRSCVKKWMWPSWVPVPNKPTVSVDVKQYFHIKPSLKCLMVSVDVKQHFHIKPSLKCLMVSVDVNHHDYLP